MVLPLLKLGTLALKTLSKPIAGGIKNYAVVHPRFRNIIVSIAQANHRITTTMQRRLYGHATDVEIRPLNEEKAVQAAVDLLGDVIVFMVAVCALGIEVNRNSRSEAKKEEKRRQQFEELRQKLAEFELRQQVAEIEQIIKHRGVVGAFNFRQHISDDTLTLENLSPHLQQLNLILSDTIH